MNVRIVIAALAAMLSVAAAHAADAPAKTCVTWKIVPVPRIHLTITGQPIVVPQGPDVILTRATLKPNQRLPVHKHPYPHYVYVLSGVLTVVKWPSGDCLTVAKGGFIAEPVDTRHYGVNNGTEDLNLITIDHVPPSVKSNVVIKSP